MNFDIQYCKRCIMPETQEGQKFDSSGICNVCRSNEDKMKIDWNYRREVLSKILMEAKLANKDKEYDCLIPISGGKDSTYQLHVLVKEFEMRPLAVTFSHNWYSSVGIYNLFNAIEKFDVDHVMFTPRRQLVNKIAKKSLEKIGDACWHCHAGIGAYPLKVAKQYGIKLVIWGESVAESSSRGTYDRPLISFDQDYFTKVSAKVSPSEFVGNEISSNDMKKFENITKEDYSTSEIKGIHLGDFIYWDEERQTEFVMDAYDWKEDHVEGTYKGYKSTECIMPGIHDFACYLKRGYGRTSFHLSSDIRSGLISKDDITDSLLEEGRRVPTSFNYYSEITGINLQSFIEILEGHKHESLKGISLPIIQNKNNKIVKKRLFLDDLKNWIENIKNV